MEYREWKLTDQEIASLNEKGGNVGEAQEAKKQAFKKAGGIILNPDALPDLYEACKEGIDNFKFEKHTSGRIEHWIDNNRANKAFTRKEKLMMAQAIRDYLTFLEDRTLKSIKRAIAKAEKS